MRMKIILISVGPILKKDILNAPVVANDRKELTMNDPANARMKKYRIMDWSGSRSMYPMRIDVKKI